MSLLVLVNQDGNELSRASRSAIAAAKNISGDIDLLIIGTALDFVSQEAAQVAGVKNVQVLDVVDAANLVAETLAPAVLAATEGYTHVIAPAVTLFKNLVPRVAALADIDMISEVTAVIDSNTYQRPLYAGSINGLVRNTAARQLITVRPTAFVAEKDQQAAAPIRVLAVPQASALSKVTETRIQKSERPSLASARVVVTGGRSLGSAEKYEEVILPLAAKLNAAIGATRAAVDAGFAPNDAQVGQTGTVVAPDIYLALGVSGAAQHIAGIKGAKTIIAINHDPDAPIFQWADYGLVADLFESAKTLEEALS